jgi:hypothetical protein
MIRTVAAGIFLQILLVIVGAEAFSSTEITELSRDGQSTGRISLDVEFDPLVDQVTAQYQLPHVNWHRTMILLTA